MAPSEQEMARDGAAASASPPTDRSTTSTPPPASLDAHKVLTAQTAQPPRRPAVSAPATWSVPKPGPDSIPPTIATGIVSDQAPSPSPLLTAMRTANEHHHKHDTPQASQTPSPHVGRKLQKRVRHAATPSQEQQPAPIQYAPTMELPEQLRDHAADEREEDVLNPQHYSGGGGFLNMNQSIFGLIAAAGSQANFADRFAADHSGSDEDEPVPEAMAMTVGPGHAPLPHGRASFSSRFRPSATAAGVARQDVGARRSADLAQTTVLERKEGRGEPTKKKHTLGFGTGPSSAKPPGSGGEDHPEGAAAAAAASSRHRRKLSQSRLLRSVPGLGRLSSSSSSSTSKASKKSKSPSSSSSSGNAAKPDLPATGPSALASSTSPQLSAPLATSRAIEDDDAEEEEEEATGTEPPQPGSRVVPGADDDIASAVAAAVAEDPSSPDIKVTRAAEAALAEADSASPGTKLAPVMSRMLEARVQMAATRPSFEMDRLPSDNERPQAAGDAYRASSDGEDPAPSQLAKMLMQIFDFEEPEEVIEEYSCWLLQNVLLQGYMYITTRHVAFYAYLPKRSHGAIKTGYLSKTGKRNPKYNRYWFRLKGDVLSYFRDSQNPYFPSGQIDLRYGISANVTDNKKDGVHFTVTTHTRTYHFRADSPPSAQEWVKALQRVIFRSHNDGNAVKISLPIDNIIDIEEAQILGFADTCKLRVIDNDDTYAIDEYFFSFFSVGKEAINVLRILIEASSPKSDRRDGEPDSIEPGSKHTSISNGSRAFPEAVRATLAPLSSQTSQQAQPPSPRTNGDLLRSSLDTFRPFARRGSADTAASKKSSSRSGLLTEPPRRSFSDGRRSLSRGRPSGAHDLDRQSRPSSFLHKHESADEYEAQSMSMDEPQSLASLASLGSGGTSALIASASTDFDPSASQILRGSDVFHSPTIHRCESPSKMDAPQGLKSQAAAAGGSSSAQRDARDDAEAGPQTPTLQSIAKIGTLPLQRAGAFMSYLDQTSRKMSNLLATESMGYVEKVSGMWKGGKKHYYHDINRRHASTVPRADAQLDRARPTDPDAADDPEETSSSASARFRAHFALPDSENLQATYFGYLVRVLPLYGKIYLGDRHFCFRSLLPGTRTKLILPLRDIENVDKEKGFRFGYCGLVVVIRGHEEIFFELGKGVDRDDLAVTMLKKLEAVHSQHTSQARDLASTGKSVLGADNSSNNNNNANNNNNNNNNNGRRRQPEDGSSSESDDDDAEAKAAIAERDALQEARSGANAMQMAEARERDEGYYNETEQSASCAPPIIFDDPKASFLNFRPNKALRVTCLTIGSRGDVQPYIALCRKLKEEGHHPRIATHVEFKSWIESHGIEYAYVGGDPSELMQLCIENGTFTWSFLREANSKFRGWLDDLLASSWGACQNSDVLIESPSAMAGIHIAEGLGIPYFRAFGMPWTRTRAYPHAFIMPGQKMGGAYNYMTYVMFDNVFWKATASQVNRWRRDVLGLPATNLEKMQVNKVPFLYNFSPSVVPPPLDFSDWIRVTGYWFLDEGTGAAWQPPKELTDFIERARRDGKKLVYVGFGSIIVPDPAKMTQEVIDAVLKSDVRCILSKGWSDRLETAASKKQAAEAAAAAKKDDDHPETESSSSSDGADGRQKKADSAVNNNNNNNDIPEPVLPPEILQIGSAPHDWLFRQVDAAAHHGGSGTTGASLRAGIPTIVRPFFGDQFFFGSRVEDLGVGICLKKWGSLSFARALWEATHSERMIVKARVLGEQIRKENGVETAVQSIYRDLEYATSLVKTKAGKNAAAVAAQAAGGTAAADNAEAATISGSVDGAAYLRRGPTGNDDDSVEHEEESWTFIGGSGSDPDGNGAGGSSGASRQGSLSRGRSKSRSHRICGGGGSGSLSRDSSQDRSQGKGKDRDIGSTGEQGQGQEQAASEDNGKGGIKAKFLDRVMMKGL